MSHSGPLPRPCVDAKRMLWSRRRQMIENDTWVTQAWSEHHGFLLDVAYRLLGSYSEAEDTVQEAFTRLLRTDLDPIEDVRAWLVVVVSRLCLDQLRSARVRREAYVGPWFPEPLIHSDEMSDPADIVTMDESVRMALLIVTMSAGSEDRKSTRLNSSH